MIDLPSRIDYAILNPLASVTELERGAAFAYIEGLRLFVVLPALIAKIREINPSLRVGTVISYPTGADPLSVKIAQAEKALEDGAVELDIVAPLYLVRDLDKRALKKEIEAFVKALGANPPILKVIIETPYLTRDEITSISRALIDTPVSFIKTSTGFRTPPTRATDVKAIKEAVGDKKGVKASGGIRSLQDALRMFRSGADLIGTSSVEKIIGDWRIRNEKQQENR